MVHKRKDLIQAYSFGFIVTMATEISTCIKDYIYLAVSSSISNVSLWVNPLFSVADAAIINQLQYSKLKF